MSKIAKLFRNGNSQAVRLPHDMRFKGDQVRIRKVGDTLVLEPIIADVKEWFAAMDRAGVANMFPKGWRKQPLAPKRKIFE
jgi:antitoxin VapB